MAKDIDNTADYNTLMEAWKKIKNIKSIKERGNSIQSISPNK